MTRTPLRAVRAVRRALTLVELMVVVAIMGILALLVAPSMSEIIGMQRLRSVNDQLATDFQFMRSEAVARNQFVAFLPRNVSTETMSCYVIFMSTTDPLNPAAIDQTKCNCTSSIGSACVTGQRELRTVQIPRDMSLELRFPIAQRDVIIASPVNGGAMFHPSGTVSTDGNEYCVEVRRTPRGKLRTSIGRSGRTSVCSPDGSVPGVAVCPAYDATIKNCQATS